MTAEEPTRLQRPAGRTRVQNAPRQPAATRIQNTRRGTGTDGPDPGRLIPPSLRYAYTIGEMLGSGGEAVVWLARPVNEPDRPVALKVYRPGTAFDLDLRRRLDRPEWRRFLPELYAYGVAELAGGVETGWEAMEYFPLGTLTDLVAREAPPGGTLPADRLRPIVAELVDSFEFWEHTIRRRQTDVSPGNLLVRSDGARPELVMGDFGGVIGTGASTRFADLMAKAAYMAPESLAGLNDPLGPYWSLGAICYELLTGRSIYGEDLTDDTARVALVFEEPDVSDLPETWRDLAGGLLTRRLEDRWGAAEVRRWLAGERVPVRRRGSGTARLPVTFASTPYTDPIALAAAMSDAADEAAAWLSGNGAARLGQWLADDLKDHLFDRRILADVGTDLVAAHVAVTAFAATYLPNLQPRYRGTPMTADHLPVLAGDPARLPLLAEAIRHGVLPYAARHRCAHPDCASTGTDGCRRLADLSRLVPRAAALAMTNLAALPGELDTTGDPDARQAAALDRTGGRVLTPAAEQDVYAAAVLLATGHTPAGPGRFRLRLRFRPREPWWLLRRRAALAAAPDNPDGLAALVAAEVLTPFARAYQRALSRVRGADAGSPGESRAWAVRLLDRLDRRAGQHTWPWRVVTVLAAVEAVGLTTTIRSWAPGEPAMLGPVRQAVVWLRAQTPDVVTAATDPLGAWQAALPPADSRWLGPAVVAVLVVACLALARKTAGRSTGVRLARVLAAVAGRALMAAYLLHLAVRSGVPVATALTTVSPWLIGPVIVGVAVLVGPLGGTPRPNAAGTAPWPARVLTGGGLLLLALLLLQRVPLPAPDPPAEPVKQVKQVKPAKSRSAK